MYVPNLGTNKGGILVSLGGGTSDSMVSMSTLDIFDLNSGTWNKQTTKGDAPPQRVNPCAVLVSNSNSQHIYMFGGQNIFDASPRPQYDDVWILALPSFTWISVGKIPDNPSGRSGHTCHSFGGQMLVVGGYLGSKGSCDNPGIYVFDASNLKWNKEFDPGSTYTVPQAVATVVGESQTANSDPNSDPTTGANNPSEDGGPQSTPNNVRLTTKVTVEPFTTTFTNGQTPVVSTYLSTATITTTAEPPSPETHVNVKLAIIIGSVLGGVIVILILAWVIHVRAKRRQSETDEVLIEGGSSENQGARPASDEAEIQTREWDVHWDGNVVFSPRQSLRVVNND